MTDCKDQFLVTEHEDEDGSQDQEAKDHSETEALSHLTPFLVLFT